MGTQNVFHFRMEIDRIPPERISLAGRYAPANRSGSYAVVAETIKLDVQINEEELEKCRKFIHYEGPSIKLTSASEEILENTKKK